MSEKILKLVEPGDLIPDPRIISRVEDMLEMAKSGQLQSLSAVGYVAGGDMLITFGPSPSPWSDIGALESLKARILDVNS